MRACWPRSPSRTVGRAPARKSRSCTRARAKSRAWRDGAGAVIIDIQQERLVVVSDLHVGNPYSAASRNLGGFLEDALRRGYNVCINGDGFEILQARFASLAADSVGVLRALRRLVDAGRSVFYVVGNHDIALENFLSAWSGI